MYYGTYAGLATLKSQLGITDTTDDAKLLAKLEDASRFVDQKSGPYIPGRPAFAVISETRYYTARHSDRLLLDVELLSVTSLKTDDDGDRTYENTWAATDYDLGPYNVYPQWRISVTPNASYSFPSTQRGVEIIGLWGYGNGQSATPYEDSGTTTAEELDASETGVDVVSGPALEVGQTILVEAEQMYVTAISTNTLTVKRGVNGTTAATHTTGKTVYIYRYPDQVREATLLYATWLFKLKDAPFGVAGSGDLTGNFKRVDLDARDKVRGLRGITVV